MTQVFQKMRGPNTKPCILESLFDRTPKYGNPVLLKPSYIYIYIYIYIYRFRVWSFHWVLGVDRGLGFSVLASGL